jgi:hypothetical protein
MATNPESPAVLLKYGEHEYLAYEVSDHSERPPTSIVIRLERHGDPRHAIFCTGSFVRGQLKNVYTAIPEQVESAEEKEMVRLFEASPQLRSFVRDWIMHAYRSYEGAGVGDGASAAGKGSRRQAS